MTIQLRQIEKQSKKATSFSCEIKRQIQKIEKDSNHSKKQSNNNNDSPINRKISQITKQALYLGDLTTNLTPEEIINIIYSFPNLFVQEVSPYQYKAQISYNVEDYEYNEETEEITPINKIISIQFGFEIKQLIEDKSRFTILFQNLSKDHSIEFYNVRQNLIEKIISY